FMGAPPSGKRVSVAYIDLLRFADGKMVEHWVQMDMLGLLQQIGALPAPGQATTSPEAKTSNRAVAERYFEAAGKGDADAALACFDPRAEFRGPMGPLPVPGGVQAYLRGFA